MQFAPERLIAEQFYSVQLRRKTSAQYPLRYLVLLLQTLLRSLFFIAFVKMI